MRILYSSILLFYLADVVLAAKTKQAKSFRIDYQNNQFLLNDKPFRYISAGIHYFRIHPNYWEDRLKRIRAAGLNAIQVYVPWNFHEVEEGVYLWSNWRNLTRFFDIAKQQNLYVLLRAGPYVCGEWENGGLPWWLLLHKPITMRTYDKKYITAVKDWFNNLLPKLKSYLHKNGGPILMVQIENEYGSYYACDRKYTVWLSKVVREHFGEDVLQYTTDGSSEYYLKCGVIPGVYPTVDFGPSSKTEVANYFAAQRRFALNGPLVNSEFYTGWFLLWGQAKQSLPSTEQLLETADYMYKLNASFNFYMFAGGTNFGFWSGAEVNAPVVSSYDFSAPISEVGDITPKYIALRNWIKTIPNWPNPPTDLPRDIQKIGYGSIRMQKLMCMHGLYKIVSTYVRCVVAEKPMTFEDLHHPYGYVIYSTILKFGGRNLVISNIKDHGFTYLDDELQGIFVNILGNYSRNSVILKKATVGRRLIIIVENRGRQTYETINDYKGILSTVTLDGKIVDEWEHCGVPMEIFGHVFRFRNDDAFAKKRWSICGAYPKAETEGTSGIYAGKFTAHRIADTFLNMEGWGKGQLMVNGHNIGRYWSNLGPQMTLYIPAPFLKRINVITLMEFESTRSCQYTPCSVQSIDHPIWNFTTHSNGDRVKTVAFNRHRSLS